MCSPRKYINRRKQQLQQQTTYIATEKLSYKNSWIIQKPDEVQKKMQNDLSTEEYDEKLSSIEIKVYGVYKKEWW